MRTPPEPHHRQRCPAELINHAVWFYRVFSLSFRDLVLILAERGVIGQRTTARNYQAARAIAVKILTEETCAQNAASLRHGPSFQPTTPQKTVMLTMPRRD